MIDINELRRLAQAASHPTTKGRWIHLFGERTVYDRMEDGCRGIPVVSTDKHPPSQFEAACLDFIAAANPAAISKLLDRLEAAEKSDAESIAMYRKARDERDELRAKVEAMERQEPYAFAVNFPESSRVEFVHDLDEAYEDMTYEAYEVRKLYLAPGAQPAPSVPDFSNTKDAARYRWLRENGLANEKRESRAVLPRGGKKASMAFRYWTAPEELDMTIDAMIAAAPEAKP